ncbi:hypothetical protein, partial [Paraburkholderia sprentiae]|uniref:hypothetical protein n=1 Tax=Paraburkholderia sprentiae TaxID=948107 RepID=UPI001EE1AB19
HAHHGPCDTFSAELAFVVAQSISRNLLPRHRAVKFPPATRFDTVWATNCRSHAPPEGRSGVGSASQPAI